MSISKKLRLSSILLLLLFSVYAFSVQLTPIVFFQDGIETDTVFVQDLITINNFQFGIGFNLKRFGFDIGYITPWLFSGIVVHAGIYHRWEDLNKNFLPAFGIGASIKF